MPNLRNIFIITINVIAYEDSELAVAMTIAINLLASGWVDYGIAYLTTSKQLP